MRRFVLGWKKLGWGDKLQARLVVYAEDFVILRRNKAEEARKAFPGGFWVAGPPAAIGCARDWRWARGPVPPGGRPGAGAEQSPNLRRRVRRSGDVRGLEKCGA